MKSRLLTLFAAAVLLLSVVTVAFTLGENRAAPGWVNDATELFSR